MKSIKVFFNIIFVVIAFFAGIDSAIAKTINFAVASDVHYSSKDFQDSGREIAKAPKALKGFVDRVNEKNYDFVIFLGDNIDKSKKDDLNGFFKAIKRMKTPYYIVMGNHDVHKISGMEKKEFLEIVSENNKRQRKAQGSYYFYPTSDVIVVVLDSVSSGMPSSHGIFTQKTLVWLDEVLTKNKNKEAIIFQHVPYMTPYEDPSHEILAKNDYRAVLSRHNNILAVFGGHYHKESFQKDHNNVMHISAPALYIPPYYYLDITVNYDKMPLQKARNFKIDGTALPAI